MSEPLHHVQPDAVIALIADDRDAYGAFVGTRMLARTRAIIAGDIPAMPVVARVARALAGSRP